MQGIRIWVTSWVNVFFITLAFLLLSACVHDDNTPPVAIAGGDRIVNIDDIVELDGSDSFDVEGSALNYAWTLHVQPARSNVEVINPAAMSTFFIPDRAGTYVVSLVVNDGDRDSKADTIKIVANSESAVFDHADAVGTCISCHDNVTATGKSDNHMATTDNCETCHVTSTWNLQLLIDHTQVLGECVSCHDGAIASGMSATHIETSDACDACHSTTAWMPASTEPGTPGGGGNTKPVDHIATTDLCETCHTNGTDQPPTTVDHNQVFGTCDDCHVKPATHLETGRQCSVCHTTDAWIPALSEIPTEQPAGHIATTNVCSACHDPDAWLPATVDHTQVIGSCVSCHNGVVASGKTELHMPTSDHCETCHIPGEPWVIYLTPVDHTQVIGTCESCHDGDIATGMSATHMVTSDPCDACHTVDAWIPASDGSGGTNPGPDPDTVPDHTQLEQTCVSCHDNVQASGKSVTHINTADMCEACHAVFPDLWVPVTPAGVDHTQVVGTCVSCHDGLVASGKSSTHITSTDLCDACHEPGPVPWIPAGAGSVDHAQVLGSCSSCHDGPISSDLPANHIPITEECDACHTTSTWLEVGPVDHTSFVGDCVDCHDGILASGKSLTHLPTTDLCDTCHQVFPTTWVPVSNSAVDHTQVLGSCSSCHDGTLASGVPAVHPDFTEECDACHVTTTWLVDPPV